MTRYISLLFSCCALASCDPTVWDALRAEAPVVIISSPGGVAAGVFGSVLTSYEADVGGSRSSRLVVAGGTHDTDSRVHAYPVYEAIERDESRLRLGAGAVLSACNSSPCDAGHGASIAAFPEWSSGTTVFHGCVAVPSRSSGKTQVFCEDQQPMFQTISGPAGEEFGASSAGIAAPRHPVGVAIFGAPAADGGNGALYRLPSGAGAPIRMDLSATNAPPGGRIGGNLAVLPLSPSAVVFATRATYAEHDRVIVGSVEVDSEFVSHVTMRACLEGPSGFGSALALGDLDADGSPDLAVGTSFDASASDESIRVFRGAELLSESHACEDPIQPAPVVTIVCADLASEDVSCGDDEGIGLGASLAIGDVDGDGIGDLIAGAPHASPAGHVMAGAVFALAGEGAAIERVGARHSVLFHSAQDAGDRLGQAVATIPGVQHQEIAAGAPGAREVAVFLCSGLGEDRPMASVERGCVDR